MAVTDTYTELKSESKQVLFTKLFELKEQKKSLDKEIKELEAQYKPMLEMVQEDLYLQVPNGVKFSIRRSVRKGNVDTKKVETDFDISLDDYRKPSTDVWTLRYEG